MILPEVLGTTSKAGYSRVQRYIYRECPPIQKTTPMGHYQELNSADAVKQLKEIVAISAFA